VRYRSRVLTGLCVGLLALGCGRNPAEPNRSSPGELKPNFLVVPGNIVVVPSDTDLLIGQCTSYSAVTGGWDQRPIIRWSSSNPRVASVTATISTGTFANVCGLSDGYTTISALADGGSQGNATSEGILVQVGQPVRSVLIQPSPISVKAGATVQLSAVAVDQYGGRATRPATWASLNPAIATVSATGLVTGKALGQTTISARINGITGTAPVTVGLSSLFISGPGQITTGGKYTWTAVVSPSGTYTYRWFVIMYGNGITQTFSSNPLTLTVLSSTGSLSLRVTVSANGVALGTATQVVRNSIPGACTGRICP
jgi:hypothetical protein